DKIRAGRVEIVEIETLQERELLQQHRALAPWPALDNCIAAVIVGQRRLDRRLPARHVVGRQEAAMAPARGIEYLLRAAEPVDRLRDKAAIPGVASAVDYPLTAPIPRFSLGKDAPVGRRESWVTKELAGYRRITA